MEYREPPRIAAAERRLDGALDDPGPRPRPRHFEFAHAQRQLDSPRLAFAILLAMVALAVAGYLVSQFSRTAIDWLHQQPRYQFRFDDIELVPPPPDWFRGGAKAFLKQVRENAKEAEVLRVLELHKGESDKDQILLDFKKFPWVEDAPRVEYPPRSIRAHLVYRVPVARMWFPQTLPVYLDREGCLLPVEDIDLERLGPLIRITGAGLERAAAGNRPGLAWRSSAAGAEAVRLEESLKDAAALAGFILAPEHVKEAAELPALRIIRIEAAEPRGLWLENACVLDQRGQDIVPSMILWGEAPDKEAPGSLKASEKWDILKNWAKNSARRRLPEHDYWEFSKSELKPVETDHRRS
ncbi:MAG: hypothetical protein ACP5XB_11700 [Isosphaeraceae bacterium]